jgi:hypothetical protein
MVIPDAIATTSAKPTSVPQGLLTQILTWPFDISAVMLPDPAATSTTPVKPGIGRAGVIGLPNGSPGTAAPNPHSVPSDWTAAKCAPLPAIAVTVPVKPSTFSGTPNVLVALAVFVCPTRSPHVHTVPSVLSADEPQ